ncbi:hypothetical protein KKH43_01290 [Patescibacteria group bacterium]|nr:hypothetical protein [Patescibacteria group bacterium]
MGIEGVRGPGGYADWKAPETEGIQEAKKPSGDTKKEQHGDKQAADADRKARQVSWNEAMKRAEDTGGHHPQEEADRQAEQQAQGVPGGVDSGVVAERYGSGVSRQELESQLPPQAQSQSRADRWAQYGTEQEPAQGETTEGVDQAKALIGQMQSTDVPAYFKRQVDAASNVSTAEEAAQALKKLSATIENYPDRRINQFKDQIDTALSTLEQ